jgi:transcriptional regulator GlxA family with amidase domain
MYKHSDSELEMSKAEAVSALVHAAGGLVGYESASQFSREYSRLFGAPPQRDIRRMRLNQTSLRR